MPSDCFVDMCIVEDHRNRHAPKPVFATVLVDRGGMGGMATCKVAILNSESLAMGEHLFNVVFNE